MSPTLDAIANRLADGSRLSEEDARALLGATDIVSIGMLADEARRERHADSTTFVRVAMLPLDDENANEWPEAAKEIRLAGSPGQDWDKVIARLRLVMAAAGTMPVSAFCLADLEERAESDGRPLRAVLDRLRRAGLELLSDAPIDRLKHPQQSLQAVNDAGLKLARATIDQPPVDPVALFRQVTALQDATAALRSFAPLPRAITDTRPTTGYDDVKRVALARLIVDNTDSIQVDWSLYGPKLAQVALTFGADDIDGVPAADDESSGRRRMTLEEIRRNIRAARQVPVERNGRFELVGS
jgi:aminodeoxyfutalosine synthase